MRVLLDECVPVRFRHLIPGHHVETVRYRNWLGKKNGNLLREAQEHFDVLVTIDQGIPSQQYMAQYDIALIVVCSDSSNPSEIKALFARIPDALDQVAPGKVIVIKLE